MVVEQDPSRVPDGLDVDGGQRNAGAFRRDPWLLERRRFLGRTTLLAGAAAAGVATFAPAATASSTASTAADGQIPVANVRDYGATGNGTTDDTAAIQAAISASEASGGGVVYLPPGTYATTGITLAAGVDLIGANRTTTILLFTEASGDVILVSSLSFNRLISFQVAFSQAVTSGSAIHVAKSFTIEISDIYINGSDAAPGYDGIFVDQSTATFIDNFNIYTLSNSGVRINGPLGNDAYLSSGIINLNQTGSGSCLLIQDYVNGAVNVSNADLLAGQYGLYVTNSNYQRYDGVYFDSSANGAQVVSGNLLTFVNCWFSNRPGPGLTIGAVRGFTVLGGQAVNCGAGGVVIGDSAMYVSLNGIQVIGNNDADVGADGILIDGEGADYISVVGCTVGNDSLAAGLQTVGQEAGIHITDQVRDSHYTITANTLFDNNVGGIVDEGDGEKYIQGNVGNTGPAPARTSTRSRLSRDPIMVVPPPGVR